jgi:CheY-like chemotaxis protein
MDLEMPVLDGLDATRRIRSSEQDGQAGHAVPIVALTAHDQASHLATCLEAGMNDFLVKPVAAPVLARTLRHWVKPRS